MAFSPDKQFISYLQDRNIHLFNLETGTSSPLTEFNPKQAGISRYLWSPDSKNISFSLQENSGVRRVGIPVFSREEVKIRDVPRPFPGDPVIKTKIGMVNILDSKIAWIPKQFDNLLSHAWSPAGKKLLMEESTPFANERYIFIYDQKNKNLDQIFQEENPKFTFSWLWSAQWLDPEHIIFTSDRSGYCHIYSLELKTKQLDQLTSGKWEVLNLFPPKAGKIYFIANKNRPENRCLYMVHPEGKKISRISSKDGVFRPFFSNSGKNICALFSDDLTPFDLYYIRKENLQRITASPFPEFKNYSWAKTHYLDISHTEDEVKIRIKMMFPSDFDPNKKYPAIVGSVYSNSVLNQWGGRDAHPTWGLDQYLVQVEKYILVNVDIRGSLGYGRKFREDMYKGYGVVDIKDLEAVALYLKSLPYIKPDNIGIWGSSYGGLLTLMSLFKKPELFACGIAGAPATNVYHAFPGQMEVMKSIEDKRAYENSSAYFWSQGAQAPIMIIHGILDSVVLFMDSVNLVRKMIKEGKEVEFVVLPDAPHAWDLGPTYQTLFAFKKMVNFFNLHLKQ